MIVIGYHVQDAGWGRKYRRVTDRDQALAVRELPRRSHVSNAAIQAVAQLNVMFHEDGTTYNDAGEEVGTFTHMRPEGEDGATQ